MTYPRCYLLLSAYLSHLVPLLTAALSFHYDFSIPGVLDSAYLMYLNDSHAAGDRINFTAMTTWSTGRVVYTEPVRLWDSNTAKGTSFTTSFSFAIGGYMNGSRADGIVFVISVFPPKIPSQSSGWLLGLYNTEYPSRSPPTIGVEFDTYWNADFDPPGKTDHMGIDINWIKSTNYTELPKLGLYGTMSANITYDAESKMMVATLWLADGSSHSVQTPVDFREAGMPQYASVGFSASTGTLFEEHQLFSWSFNSTDTAPTDPPSKTKMWMIVEYIAIGLICGVVLTIIIAAAYRCFRQGTRNIQLPVVREFLYGELIKATNNFKTMLGSGSFGEVYRGELRHQGTTQLVAVKKLTQPLEKTRKHFVSEVHILGQLSHRNLVKLVGWCWHRNLTSKIFCQCFGRSRDKLLLVYELVSNKSLDEHLHDAGMEVLAWPERYKIVLGIGAAIDYLHNGSSPEPILHRDIKPSNVMLDKNFEPKLGDFGLVRKVNTGSQSLRGTQVMGDKDYIEPQINEDIKSSTTTASDMYSFGLMLLEMATGRKPTVPDGDQILPADLVNLIRESYGNGKLLEMADERLKCGFDKKEMERVLVVGLLCTQLERQNRPDIKKAVKYLSDLEVQAPRVLL
ncbi:unnamed protein product [Urochloa decumbens]|uniref:non-specific serine/threonine protein kinase n=1 Tax=Urochloa decumbens TaxID=240449 RepID=A0ABC9AIL1_9POAL